MGKNKTALEKVIQMMTHQSDVSPAGLKKYDLVVIGGHIGGNLAKAFEKGDHGSPVIIRPLHHFRGIQHGQKRPAFHQTSL